MLFRSGIWSRAAQGRWPGEPGRNELDTGAPFYEVYTTSDSEFMAVGSIEPQFWSRLLEGLDLDAGDLPDQWDRGRWPEMKEVIAQRFATRTRSEWAAIFELLDACVTPVLSMTEAAQDPHLTARRTLVDAAGGPQPAPAPRLSNSPLRLP